MTDFDVFNPKVSRVIADATGKILTIYSSANKVGKTTQACRFPKPLYLRFEQGINSIANLKYIDLTCWRDFKKVNKQLTDPKNIEELKQLYSTIIFDTLDVAIRWAEDYILSVNGVGKLKDIAYGGGYHDFEVEWFREINKLTNAGYTIIFISHAKEVEMEDPVTKETYTQVRPIGGKRDSQICLDISDLIGYVQPNGFDDNGNEIPSSIYFTNTRSFVAGSRFKHMKKVVEVFTAENVIAAIKEAVEKEAEETGTEPITLEQKKEIEKKEKISFDELLDKVQKVGQRLIENEHSEDLLSIVENILGAGKKVSECTPKQYEAVETIYDELSDRVKELGL